MCALQVVLDKGQEDDWWSSSFITSLAVTAAVALAAFVVWELRRPDPIVDLRLFRNRNFAIGNILMFMVGFVLLSSTVLLPLFVQSLLGYTATEAGLMISPGGFAVMAMMPVVGILVGRTDARWLIAFGLISTSLALLNMTRFDTNVDYATVAWARIYQSVGLAFLFIPINTIAFLGLPPGKNNHASAMINMVRNIGGSFGIAIATTVLARQQQIHHNVLAGHVTPWSAHTTPRSRRSRNLSSPARPMPPTRSTRRRPRSTPSCSGRPPCCPTSTPSGCWPPSSPRWCRWFSC